MPAQRPKEKWPKDPFRFPTRKTTTTGRVVYNRPVHLFNYRDGLRIIRKLDPIDNFKDAAAAAVGVYILVDRLRDAIAANLYAIRLGDQAGNMVRQAVANLLVAIANSLPSDAPAREAIMKVVEILYSL